MKTFKKYFNNTLLRLHFSLENFHDMFTVKGGRSLVNILKGMFIMCSDRITPGSIRYIVHFIVFAKRLLKSQGRKGLVLYLKACGVSVQQAIGGHVVHDPRRLGAAVARSNTGLPRFIPQHIRIRIRAGDPVAIRITLTLINLYRVIEFPGTLKIKTITQPSKGHGGLDSQIESYLPLFVKLFIIDRGFDEDKITRLLNKYSNDNIIPMFKGGPGVKGALGQWNTMPWIMLRALKALQLDPKLWEAMTNFLGSLSYERMKFGIKVGESVINADYQGVPLIKPLPYLGKLGLKAEAAGKIRVFAMVDAWTQWILYPMHKLAFDILHGVKMDGTFDQTAPLQFIRGDKGLFSLDLSAATDRIPLRVQRQLWSFILGHELAGSWALLLTGRAYRLHNKDSYEDLHYAVGQPMGALSSWASLALIHHFLVQVAAWRAGYPTWKLYTNYAILGDDIVIGDRAVMIQYLDILDSLGVECGLHKSLLSPGGLALEFAKRTIFKGVDVSPLPIREFYAASKGIGAFVELTEKYGQPLHRSLQAFGVGWKVRSWLNKPIGKLPARVRLLILAINVPRTPEAVTRFFELGQAPITRYLVDTFMVIQEFLAKETGRLKSQLLVQSNKVKDFDSSMWGREQVIALRESMNVQKFGYVGRLLADALTNIANMTWHLAKVDNIQQAQDLMKRLHNLEASDFATAYLEFISLQSEIARRSFHVFSTSRPNPPEIKGIMDPSQVRLWKRWSAILQGSKPLKVPQEANED